MSDFPNVVPLRPEATEPDAPASWVKFTPHPMLEIIPPHTEAERANMRASLVEFGQIDPLLVWRGHLLDGRERQDLLVELGVEPRIKDVSLRFEPFQIEDAIIKANISRLRQFTTTALAVLACQWMDRDQQHGKRRARTQLRAALLFNASVEQIKTVRHTIKAQPQLVPDMLSGRISGHAAASLAKIPEAELDGVLKSIDAVPDETGKRRAAKAAASVVRRSRGTKRPPINYFPALFNQLGRANAATDALADFERQLLEHRLDAGQLADLHEKLGHARKDIDALAERLAAADVMLENALANTEPAHA